MFWFVDYFWSLVCTCLFIVSGFITRYTFRYHGGENYKKIDSDCGVVHRQQDDPLGPNIFEESGFGENKNSEYDLGFESWGIEDCNESHEETESSVFMETVSTTNTSKYLFMYGNDMSGFMKEPKVMSFTIHEVCLDSNDDQTILDSSDKDFRGLNLEAEDVHQEKTEDSAENIKSGEVLERDEEETYRGLELIDIGEIAGLEKEDSVYKHDLSDEIPSENHLFSLKLEPLPAILEDGMDIGSHQIDSTDDAILSDMSIGEGTEHMLIDTNEDMVELREETPYLAEIRLSEKRISESEENISEDEFIELEPHSGIFNDAFLSEQDFEKSEDKHESNESVHEEGKPMDSSEKSEEPILQEEELSVSDSDDEMRFEVLLNHQDDINQLKHELKESTVHEEKEPMENSTKSQEPSLEEEELSVSDSDNEMRFEVRLNHQDDVNQLKKHESKELSVHEEKEPMENLTKSQEPSLEEEESSVLNSDDEMGVEVLREHQDYIQQLKQELKHVKIRGLPTIMEESEESPKMAEDLKPMKIDKKMEYKDRVEEIHKFYKSYAEKMRKLDILNNQTMHAIGLLKLKEPAQLNSTKKSSIPAFKSLLSQKFRQSKVGNHDDNPTQKFIKELQRDLELVYVGQVCLSWEILNWQHRKAQELQDYDPNGFRQYNCVAGEYQQYQVLLQRFIENEPFQERPRIQNYVENRCVLRSFFQVPAIKDDCMKDKKPKQEGEYVIPIGMFTEIIGESMRLFWEFIRADKDDANATSRGLHGANVDLEEPADLELLIDIQTNLQKKEKKLKELLRSRTCIVKRFQKTQEDQLDRTLFYVQIEMKLVAKVLNMSRLTKDQLVWCHKKLEEINFVSRSLCIEPSFLLFPC